MLQGIYEDTSWLIHSIENILSMTRMDEGKISINKSMEAVEEVVGEAISRVEKLRADHGIRVRICGTDVSAAHRLKHLPIHFLGSH
ncbi:hypothetical protein [Paenibacillus macerans]|uniref:hypothetical protein n=1 Tax=Paenibacillus macerans TaxID=44252 RepID=UPI003D30F681